VTCSINHKLCCCNVSDVILSLIQHYFYDCPLFVSLTRCCILGSLVFFTFSIIIFHVFVLYIQTQRTFHVQIRIFVLLYKYVHCTNIAVKIPTVQTHTVQKPTVQIHTVQIATTNNLCTNTHCTNAHCTNIAVQISTVQTHTVQKPTVQIHTVQIATTNNLCTNTHCKNTHCTNSHYK